MELEVHVTWSESRMFPGLALIFPTSCWALNFWRPWWCKCQPCLGSASPSCQGQAGRWGYTSTFSHAVFSERQKTGRKLFILISEDRNKKNYLPTVSEPIKLNRWQLNTAKCSGAAHLLFIEYWNYLSTSLYFVALGYPFSFHIISHPYLSRMSEVFWLWCSLQPRLL